MGATDFLMTQRRVKEVPPTISDPNTITVAATLVADRRFWRHLQNLRELKSFLTSEGVTFSDEDLEATQLGELDILSFSRSGRIPSADEWRQIDTKTNRLTRYLSYCLRRKLHLFRLRMYFRILPIIFIVFAIMALILNATTRYAITDKNGGLTVMGGLLDFLSNIFWILALGGLGACAYLGTSLIAESRRFSDRDASAPHGSVSQSSSAHVVTTNVAEIDLTDVNLLVTRIIVEILFAFTVRLPVYTTQGIHGGALLHRMIVGPTHDIGSTDILVGIGWTLVPFILGFSTTLVLRIMERFVSTAATFFGLDK